MFKKIKKTLNLALAVAFLSFFGLATKVMAISLGNPLAQGKAEGIGATELYGRIIAGFLGIVGTVALVIFVWGGFLWLTSGGSPEKIKKGRDTLVWAILGLIVVFGSYIILKYVITAITKATTS
jgi:hypothetical protein